MATATATADAEAREGVISRREFLYYIWGASLALFTAEFTGLMIWFALPRFREGEFGGTFPIDMDALPEVNAPPVNVAEGRFWLVNVDNTLPDLEPAPASRMWQAQDEGPIKGVAAVYKVCTHLGCIYAWNDANNRFECPCHGSKYRLDGRRIESPAPRTLDRFRMAALDADRNVLAQSEPTEDGFYQVLELPEGTALLQVDTGDRARGPENTLLCSFVDGCP